jgi:hypothetical protein
MPKRRPTEQSPVQRRTSRLEERPNLHLLLLLRLLLPCPRLGSSRTQYFWQ